MARTLAPAAAALLALASVAAQAQDGSGASGSGASSSGSSAPGAPATGAPSGSPAPVSSGGDPVVLSDRTPVYVGVSETLTHTSNVFRTADARADWFSTTSLFGGASARLGRQRLYGSGNIGVDRYFDETRQNNTHYGLDGGLDWETVARLNGNVDVGADRSATAPPIGSDDPDAKKKRTQTSERISGLVRWGGDAAITLELRGGASKVDYSGGGADNADNTANTVSFGVFYRPGTKLRLGVALRQNKTKTDGAFVDTASGDTESNTARSRNVDLLADYANGSNLNLSGRLSYTKLDNSNGAADSDFSGLTGSVNVGYRVSGKINANVYASRDAGTNGTAISYAVPVVTLVSNPDGTTTPVVGTTTTAGLYQSTQRSTTVGGGVTYAATARISADAGASYTRQKLLRTVVGVDSPTVNDRRTFAYIGFNYNIGRNFDTGCRYTHEKRDISDGGGDDYRVNTIGCRVAYTLR